MASSTSKAPPATDSKMSSPPPLTLWSAMARRPTFFLVFFPVLFAIFIGVGWGTVENKVEDAVSNIWTQQRSDYAKDQAYVRSLSDGKSAAAAGIGTTAFAALAATRDGGNLFTEERITEIFDRMKETEATTITYKDEVYAWDDFCFLNSVGLGTSYNFPCARFTPMDFFQEARWFFDEEKYKLTWYNEVVKKVIVKPRLERFGILQGVCSTLTGTSTNDVCDHVILLRNSADYAQANGYSLDYANPVALFGDIGSLELNHPCKMCMEEQFETTMSTLESAITQTFQVLALELSKAADAASVAEQEQGGGGGTNSTVPFTSSERIQEMLNKVSSIQKSLSRQAVVDYFTYSVVRQLYSEFGAPALVNVYPRFMSPNTVALCSALLGTASCPNAINITQAKEVLRNHADNTFSSINTAGNALPFWSEADGSGFLFAGNRSVGGSGIDLSGTRLSMTAYLDLTNYGTDDWAPLYSSGNVPNPDQDPFWAALVETDPVYRWFMAGETQMTAHCGNGLLPGTNTGDPNIDDPVAAAVGGASAQWCSKYNVPFEQDGNFTQQHFARLWFDLLVDSPQFLGVTQGESDPYVWTMGQGCGYSLGGVRFPYTNQSDQAILGNASGELYYIDEGVSLGAVDRNLLMGGTVPKVGDYSYDNPLQKVEVIQTVYPALLPAKVVDRVKNCNRPRGPVNITLEDAEEIHYLFKEAFEAAWTKGWDDDQDGQVQFVGFFDDRGTVGTTGRLLRDITLSNGTLTAVSILIILVFSAIFLFSCDLVESRVLVTTVGVALVLLAYFAAIGFALIMGIKINITIAWTLPFILMGLGVDDMYIVLETLNRQKGYTEQDFTTALSECIVPVTMTSLTNAAMFAVMNLSDVPAVYLTAQVAVIAITFLYLAIVLCFPAFCWLDMRRQAAGRYDVLICVKKDHGGDARSEPSGRLWSSFIYDSFYKPIVLGSKGVRMISHSLIWIGMGLLLGFGIYGLTQRQVGLGLEDFFPQNHQANRWATIRTEELGSWSIQMNWGALDYVNPETQMLIIKQFEDVVATPHVADIDTKSLWIANFAIWTTRQCNANFAREDFSERRCGRDQVIDGDDNNTCSGFWMPNTLDLKLKIFKDKETCAAFEEGICRPTSQMHPLDLAELELDANSTDATTSSWCPVFGEGWDDSKMEFCLRRWRKMTGGGGGLLLQDIRGTPSDCEGEYLNDERVRYPIPYSASPAMYNYGLTSHEITMEMLHETRAICDNDPVLHCFMLGIPYDYWSQYADIFSIFWELGGTSIAVGFIVSFFFLFFKISSETQGHPAVTTGSIVIGCLVGSFLIAFTTFMSLISVAGLSFLAGTNLTGFSNMSFVLSVGFSVEYSVHIVARWLRADPELATALDRVEFTMNYLTVPTFMSFVSSTIGVACLAFTDFKFNEVFFFRPLIIVMFVTYFIGCWWLPVLLTLLDFDQVKLGVSSKAPEMSAEKQVDMDDSDKSEQKVVEDAPKVGHTEDLPGSDIQEADA